MKNLMVQSYALLLFLLLCMSNIVSATDYVTVQRGAWEDPATWGGNGPGSDIYGDSIHIIHRVDIDGTLKLFQGSVLTVENILILREGDLLIEDEQVSIIVNCGLIIVENGNFINKDGMVSLAESGIQICNGNYTDESNGPTCGTLGSGYIFNADGNIECMGSAPFSAELHCFCADGNGVNLPGSADDPEGCPPGSKQDRCKDTTFYQNLLPVTWVEFSADQIGADIELSWRTVNEINCKEYLLECSTNDYAFIPLAILKAKGESGITAQYDFTHSQAALSGINHWYYRVSQIDMDGTRNEYKIITVTIDDAWPNYMLYPNPASFKKELFVQGKSIFQVEIYSLNGQLIQRLKYDYLSKVIIPTDQFQIGLYTLKINKNTALKLVIN